MSPKTVLFTERYSVLFPYLNGKRCVPTGIRTPVAAVKGRCPRPLDDGDPGEVGGARRDRTVDLLHAMQALSQLSYGPIQRGRILRNSPRSVNALAKAMASPAARASARLPRIASVWSIGGETLPPDTATRSGCATLPSPSPPASASAWIAPWIAAAVQSVQLTSVDRACCSTGPASADRCLRAAFSS